MNTSRSIDYDRLGRGYARHRSADSRIAERIHAALGDVQTIVNVGAGAGSYEPPDRYVLAIERSAHDALTASTVAATGNRRPSRSAADG